MFSDVRKSKYLAVEVKQTTGQHKISCCVGRSTKQFVNNATWVRAGKIRTKAIMANMVDNNNNNDNNDNIDDNDNDTCNNCRRFQQTRSNTLLP